MLFAIDRLLFGNLLLPACFCNAIGSKFRFVFDVYRLVSVITFFAELFYILILCIFFCPLLFFANWFCLLIFALCSFWPFKFFHPAWTLFWTALLYMTLKFPRIYYQPYLHSKETIGCSHTKLSHLHGCVTVINDLLSAKEWRKTKLVWRHSISDHTILMLLRTWSRVCFFSFQLKIFEVYLLSNWFVYCACIAVWNRESAIAFNCSQKNMS